jgi:chromatin remodeling complex protein RSC6
MADALHDTEPLQPEAAKAVTEVDEYDALIAYHTSAAQAHRAASTKLRKLKTQYVGMRSRMEAGKAKRKARSPSSVSGFNQPVRVKPKLAEFLNLAPDDRVTRHEVTRHFTAFFKQHDLPNPDNRREIRMIGAAGAQLRELFPDFGTADQPLSYFNLQKALKDYFVSDNDGQPAPDPAPAPGAAPAPDPVLVPDPAPASVKPPAKLRKVVRGAAKA